jgi:hypothetical protein
MKEFEWDLEGYKPAGGCEINGGEFGIKMFVRMNRDLNDEDNWVLSRAQRDIEAALRKESLRLDPATHEWAALTRSEIMNLFTAPIFVEEIPNGYCSQYCCAFKPWFVVTTSRGRIKIGWRKSVIHLEWTDSAIKGDAEAIFPKEEAWPGYETTAYDKVIHAHGYDAARRYIARLMEAA